MTSEELDNLWLWLKVTYPKKYRAFSEQEGVLVKDNLSFAFEKYNLDEVMTAYRYFNEKTPYEPTASEIKTYIAEKKPKAEKKEDFSEEHHYTKGRYLHEEAYDAWVRDQRNGTRNGKTFKDYIKEYPNIVWRPWVTTCPDHWRGVEYKGWERVDGLVKPKGAPAKSALTLLQLAGMEKINGRDQSL